MYNIMLIEDHKGGRKTDFELIVQLIGNVGFPIALSVILLQTILVKFNKQMESLEKRLNQLDKTMNMFVKGMVLSTASHLQKTEGKEY